MEYQLITSRFPSNEPLKMVEQILFNRGIHPNDIQHYLNTTDNDILDPNLISGIRQGAEILVKHISQNDKVLLQIDSDCDGFTSAAILLNYLHCLFPGFVENNILYRIHTGKQHGIILDTIPDDVKLVIAPDSSSNNFEEHQILNEKGVDVLVIDHHEAEKISEYACIINNQLCDYPTKSLSGAGMVYKFCSYIDSLLGTEYANQFLDVAALGIVADVMDLRDFETRHLVIKGLDQIRNPYFNEMVRKNEFSLRDGITPIGVAFYIAPYVNATIRMGTQDEKLMLFESMLDYRGYEQIPSTKRGCKGQVETRVEQACRNCTNIKNRQTKARDASLEMIEQLIETENLLSNKLLIIKLDTAHEVDRNLTGLIANQLMSKYQRPVLLLHEVIDDLNNKTWEGSGRGYDKSKFNNFKEFINSSGLALYAEGHSNAFGAGFADEQIDNFINYSNNALKDFDFSPCYKVDFIFQDGDFSFNKNDILEIASLKHLWGQGIDEPFIALENIKISKNNVQLMSKDKNPTLKITLSNGTSLIKFKSSNEEFESLCSELGCVTINVVGRCEQNIWNGIISPQIIIEAYEIIGETKYYF